MSPEDLRDGLRLHPHSRVGAHHRSRKARRMATSLSIVSLLGSLTSASATMAQSVAGYYETRPDAGGARNRMCIASGPGNTLAVDIESAYCPGPSPECYNARLGSIQFNARLAGHAMRYDDGHGCRVDITFRPSGARVLQAAHCRGAQDYNDLEASGVYRRVKPEVDDRDCAP